MQASKGRVLVVDETPDRSAELVLAGFEAKCVGHEKQAIALARKENFDVVLLDMSLPGVHGAMLARRMREAGSTAAFVLLASRLTNQLAYDCIEAGALQVLEKSIATPLLEKVLVVAVERTRNVLSQYRGILYPYDASPRRFAATAAKNEFGSLLDAVDTDGAVVITKHDEPAAVLFSYGRVNRVLEKNEPNLQGLTEKVDALIAKMQTEESRRAVDSLFAASPEEFAASALAEAQKR
jgi:prevent-host-death family protein